MYLQTIKMKGGFHTQVRKAGRSQALFAVATFDSITPRPAGTPIITADRKGFAVWVGRRFSMVYVPGVQS
jgi:hypothetical protein